MALFEFDQGHLIPAQFGRPVSGSLTAEVIDSLRRQVLEIIARPLFPVTWEDAKAAPVGAPEGAAGENGPRPAGGAIPRLTALDASGQVVSVEVFDLLDSAALIGALSRLGATSSLGWSDLAAAYPGGIGAFRNGWTQFRDAMPPRCDPGPRLVLVVAQIDAEVRPALEALSASGLEVHQVSLREMSNGRRFLDVQKVHSSLFGHDTNLLAGRAARAAELSTGPAQTQVPVLETGMTSEFSRLTDAPLTPADSGYATQLGETGESTVQTGSISRKSIMAAVQETQGGTALKAKAGAGENLAEENAAEENLAEESAGVQESLPEETSATETSAENFKKNTGEKDPYLHHDASGLLAIATLAGGQVTLVWPLEAGGQEALVSAELREDGLIVFEEKTYDNPSELCQLIAGRELPADGPGEAAQGLDGWQLWRLAHAQGPSLAEACAEVNAEIAQHTQSRHVG